VRADPPDDMKFQRVGWSPVGAELVEALFDLLVLGLGKGATVARRGVGGGVELAPLRSFGGGARAGLGVLLVSSNLFGGDGHGNSSQMRVKRRANESLFLP